MIDFLFADANTPFSIALGLVLCLGLLEGLGLLIGLSLSTLLDNISPIDVDIDLDASPDLSAGGLTSIVGWLCLNRLPLLVWLVLFLTLFSIVGFSINYATGSLTGYYMPIIVAFPLAFFIGLVLTGRLGQGLAKIIPKNESSAVHSSSFAGRVAQITLGTARQGSPAEASFSDHYQQKHYVMVEPMETGKEFHQGDKVVLVEKGSSSWLVTGLE